VARAGAAVRARVSGRGMAHSGGGGHFALALHGSGLPAAVHGRTCSKHGGCARRARRARSAPQQAQVKAAHCAPAARARRPAAPPPAPAAAPPPRSYSRWLTDWVTRLEPSPSDELLIVARGQHVGRWKSSRGSYPEARRGGAAAGARERRLGRCLGTRASHGPRTTVPWWPCVHGRNAVGPKERRPAAADQQWWRPTWRTPPPARRRAHRVRPRALWHPHPPLSHPPRRPLAPGPHTPPPGPRRLPKVAGRPQARARRRGGGRHARRGLP
jgi:hypothetical protein